MRRTAVYPRLAGPEAAGPYGRPFLQDGMEPRPQAVFAEGVSIGRCETVGTATTRHHSRSRNTRTSNASNPSDDGVLRDRGSYTSGRRDSINQANEYPQLMKGRDSRQTVDSTDGQALPMDVVTAGQGISDGTATHAAVDYHQSQQRESHGGRKDEHEGHHEPGL